LTAGTRAGNGAPQREVLMRKFVAILVAALIALPCAAWAQAWPSRPIKFVIPFGPGSASDALARIAGQELSQTLGQQVVVIHKPGADGAIAAVEVQRSPPDGYTFLFGTNSPLAVAPNLRKDAGYDPIKDFTPVTFLGDNTFFVVVHPSVPAASIAELVSYAKANPGKLDYAAGNTFAMVSMSMFGTRNGIDMQAVPYKSEPDAIIDLLAGRVRVMNATVTTVGPHIRDGKLRALSTSFGQRSALLPDVPSLTEAGQPEFPVGPWFALVGPAGLPRDIVDRMSREMAAALAKPQVREPMLRQGFVPRSSTPEELAAYIRSQLSVWRTALKDAGIEQQ
jgi:tripartite-type tricarboxylate transporter receptor subunit TctC